MQYFKPDDPYFVGDCMPFYHDGTFHLYYLLDRDHHQSLGGLGGHQWAHASTRDLVHWQHHPLAISITEDWEGSICTGSVFFNAGRYYGFYAVRMPDRTQHLALATSDDGVRFTKTGPRPFASPGAEYSPYDYRDPCVFAAPDGRFHMLVTASLMNPSLHDRGGCLLHLTSLDLSDWQVQEPFLIPGGDPGFPSVPECPDYFTWNGWHYLIFGMNGMAHYRMSRTPWGPWLRPPVDSFDGSLATVMKTAAYHDNRRIGVAFLNTRQDNLDQGQRQYAGNAVFRELLQRQDGTLGVRFPPEMELPAGQPFVLPISALTPGVLAAPGGVQIDNGEGMAAAVMDNLPLNVRLRLWVRPQPYTAEFGLCLRGAGRMESGYYLRCLPYEQKVTLNQQSLSCVTGLDRAFQLEVVLKDDIIDVCIDGQRCLIDRCPELRGARLFFYCANGAVAFDTIEIRELTR